VYDLIDQIMVYDIAGPGTGCVGVRGTTNAMAERLLGYGLIVSDRTGAQLWKAHTAALRVCGTSRASVRHPARDAPCSLLAQRRAHAMAEDSPLMSVDPQQKERMGRLYNAGRQGGQHPEGVKDHDVRADADGIAVPYGLSDMRHNPGTVSVG